MKNRRSIYAWAMYDWANSAYATTVMAGFFPLFFKAYWANPENPSQSTFYLGLANSLASIIVAGLSPFLGAIADKATAKKKFLASFFFLGIVMTGGLWLVEQGYWQMAVLFYVAATVGWSGSLIFYDSLLPSLAAGKKADMVSSLGYALGYIGGGILFLMNVLMYLKPDIFGIAGKAIAVRLSFLSVAVWWAIFSIPVFLFVKEPKLVKPVKLSRAVRAGWREIFETLSDLKHFRVVGLFLIAYWLYIDGVDTIVRMAVDYGKSLQFDDSVLITALLIVQFIAFPAALLYGWLSTKTGVKEAILIAIGGYSFITIFGFLMQQEWHFYFLAVMVGLFQGGIQALSRSLFARIIPKEKAGQFYGFYNMIGKFAAVIGPFLMGVVTLLTGSARVGILSILILFIAGALLLWRKVNIAEGERIAREYLSM